MPYSPSRSSVRTERTGHVTRSPPSIAQSSSLCRPFPRLTPCRSHRNLWCRDLGDCLVDNNQLTRLAGGSETLRERSAKSGTASTPSPGSPSLDRNRHPRPRACRGRISNSHQTSRRRARRLRNARSPVGSALERGGIPALSTIDGSVPWQASPDGPRDPIRTRERPIQRPEAALSCPGPPTGKSIADCERRSSPALRKRKQILRA